MDGLQEKITPVAGALAEVKPLKAVGQGINSALPIIMVGSIAVLFANLSVPGYQAFIVENGIRPIFSTINSMTMGLLAVYASLLISYRHAQLIDIDAISCGIISLGAFLIATPIAQTAEGVNAIPVRWLGSPGLFLAIILGVIVPLIYKFLMDRKIFIRMPAGVPPVVEKSFAALTPGFLIFGIMGVLTILLSKTTFGSLHQIIYTIIQAPLTKLGGTYWAYLLIQTLTALVMFCGIHGTTVMSILTPVLIALNAENLAAYEAGLALPNIICQNFNIFGAPGGIGGTIGFAVLMMFFAKSAKGKALGKVTIVPSIFGINEPVVFGVPILLNPIFFIPYLLSPIIHVTLAYVLTSVGIIPRLIGLQLNFTIPPIISGFLSGGPRAAIFQACQVFISMAIYYPFFKIMDTQALEEEVQAAQAKYGKEADI